MAGAARRWGAYPQAFAGLRAGPGKPGAAATAPANAPPVNTGVPAITGTAAIRQTLTCSTGTWTGDATITFAYQWKRDGTNIGGATAATYVLVAADGAALITCAVTGTNGVGNSTAVSAATAAVILVPVQQGVGLRAGSGAMAASPSTNIKAGSKLVMATALRHTVAISRPTISDDSGGALTWSVLEEHSWDAGNGGAGTSPFCKQTVWQANVAADIASLVVTTTFTGTFGMSSIQEIPNQVAIANFNSGHSIVANPAPVLGTAPLVTSALINFLAAIGNVAPPLTPPTGFTLTDDRQNGTSLHQAVGVRNNTTSPAATWALATFTVCIATVLEAKAI